MQGYCAASVLAAVAIATLAGCGGAAGSTTVTTTVIKGARLGAVVASRHGAKSTSAYSFAKILKDTPTLQATQLAKNCNEDMEQCTLYLRTKFHGDHSTQELGELLQSGTVYAKQMGEFLHWDYPEWDLRLMTSVQPRCQQTAAGLSAGWTESDGKAAVTASHWLSHEPQDTVTKWLYEDQTYSANHTQMIVGDSSEPVSKLTLDTISPGDTMGFDAGMLADQAKKVFEEDPNWRGILRDQIPGVLSKQEVSDGCKLASHFQNEWMSAGLRPGGKMHKDYEELWHGVAEEDMSRSIDAGYGICQAWFAMYQNDEIERQLALPTMTLLLQALARRAGEDLRGDRDPAKWMRENSDGKDVVPLEDNKEEVVFFVTHDVIMGWLGRFLQMKWNVYGDGHSFPFNFTWGLPITFNTQIVLELIVGDEPRIQAWAYNPGLSGYPDLAPGFTEKKGEIALLNGKLEVSWSELKAHLIDEILSKKVSGGNLPKSMDDWVRSMKDATRRQLEQIVV